MTSAVDRQVVAELVARAQADGMAISGEGGLMQQLTKIVLESSLAGEMDAHLGYAKHDPAGRDSGNSRNGNRAKTVLTEAGPVEVYGASVSKDTISTITDRVLEGMAE